MQTVLSQLNSVPGVVGSLVCDAQGRILSQAFPPVFDDASLEGAAAVLADGADGLELSSGSIDMLDLRFGEARIVVKPLAGALLLVLCTRAINLQFLVLSVGMAVGKLARLQTRPQPAPAAAPAAVAAPAEDNRRRPAAERSAGDPKGRKAVPAPAKGLEQLRKLLGGGGESGGQ